MRFMKTTLLWASALAVSSETRYQVKESHPMPNGFVREGPAPPWHTIRLQLMLKQDRFEDLEAHILEISNPGHSRYGKYLTSDEVAELSRPHAETLRSVYGWLDEHLGAKVNAIESNAAGDHLSLSLTVAQAERLLDTNFFTYRHQDGTRLVRAPEWKLPDHLHQHIVTIQPTTSFARHVPRARAWSGGESHALHIGDLDKRDDALAVDKVCNISAVTPRCLRTLYGTVDYTPQVPGTNRLGVTNFRKQVDNRSDIGIFLQRYRPEAISAAEDFDLISVNGGTLQQTPLDKKQLGIFLGGEGDLDAEYLLSLAWPTPLTSWSVAGAPPFIPDADSHNYTEIEPYLVWLDYVLQQNTIPQVISSSYSDDEQEIPPAYAHAVCAKFAQLAARGVTFLTGSGDGGVGGTQSGGHCLSNKDNRTVQFIPQFPSTCPYVTSVGGTFGFDPEVAAYVAKNGFASGMLPVIPPVRFHPSLHISSSTQLLTPPRRRLLQLLPPPSLPSPSTISAYLSTIRSSFAGLYNRSGRAYPDIAAYAVNLTQIWNGTGLVVDGTSAATPIVAATISLVNDALLAAGKPALGWLNPWLYEGGGKEGFVDVVSGSAVGCNGTGFPAVEGWDAVSGFGTPRFDRLLKAAGLEPSSCKGYNA